MSWLFSRALVAEYSAADFSVGGPSAPLRLMHTPQPFLLSDKTTAFSSPSQFGLTCEPLSVIHGEVLLMSYRAAFHARTSAQPDSVPESKASDPASGWKWPASFVKFDPNTHSWRTRQCSLLGGLEEFSETWPRWGSMRDGECLALTTPALHTNASESGSWPTIRSSDGERGGRGDLIQAIRGNPNSHYKAWPMPTVKGNYNKKGLSAKSGDGLATAVARWPTPHGFSKDGRSNGPSGNELGRAVNRSFPTPVSKSPTGGRMGLDGGSHARNKLVEEHGEEAMKELTGGSLNPPWVEWLMGWPIEWTALKPLAMDRFQPWLFSHGGC